MHKGLKKYHQESLWYMTMRDCVGKRHCLCMIKHSAKIKTQELGPGITLGCNPVAKSLLNKHGALGSIYTS